MIRPEFRIWSPWGFPALRCQFVSNTMVAWRTSWLPPESWTHLVCIRSCHFDRRDILWPWGRYVSLIYSEPFLERGWGSGFKSNNWIRIHDLIQSIPDQVARKSDFGMFFLNTDPVLIGTQNHVWVSFDSKLIFSRFWLGANYRTRFLHRNSNCRIRIPGPTVLWLGFFARSDQRDSNFISSNPLPAPMTAEVENWIDGVFFSIFFFAELRLLIFV